MIGTIMIEGLEIECIVGIHPAERTAAQMLLIDVELDRDFEAAAHHDDVEHTVDYVDLAKVLTDLATAGRYRLIETYAEEAATTVLRQFSGTRVKIKVMKPAAVPSASWAAVQIERVP